MTGHPLMTLRSFTIILLRTNTRALVARLLILAAFATTVAACGGKDDDAGPVATTAPANTAAAADRDWKKLVPGGDCECADGSEFAFWERRADPTKVVLFLDGGGSCFDAKSCAFTGLGTPGEGNYDWSIYGEDPAQEGGSSTSPAPTTRSASTASSTCRSAPVTCT